MEISESIPSQLAVIEALYIESFGEEENQVVAKLAVALAKLDSNLSLVATEKDHIVGHIVYSPVSISGNENLSGYILAPLAVSPSHQKRGVGKSLIEKGFSKLSERGVEVVFVLGDPNYYRRLGFHTDHSIQPPYVLDYPEAWQVIALKPEALKDVKGTVSCVPVLMAPELW